MKPGKKTWIWTIVAFVIIGLALSGAGYWWFIRGIARTPAGEASGEAAPTLNPQQVVRGEQLYQINCAQCHGGLLRDRHGELKGVERLELAIDPRERAPQALHDIGGRVAHGSFPAPSLGWRLASLG